MKEVFLIKTVLFLSLSDTLPDKAITLETIPNYKKTKGEHKLSQFIKTQPL